MSTSTTLPTLLAAALGSLEQTYVQYGAGSKEMPSLDLWSNLIRVLDEVGTDRRELPTIVRLSKRALRTRISAAARHKWVEERGSGRGQANVRLTVQGLATANRWKDLQHAAEEHWRAKVGAEWAGKLRISLEAVVAMLPLEHPHYPATYGPADARITGGNGQDWKAVRRVAGGSVSDLPLSSLASQALVAFAMNYEEMSPVALSLSTAIIRRVPPAGCHLRDLGHSAGVSALLRHGFLRTNGNGGDGIVYLTTKGLAVSSAYEERLAAVEAEWSKGFGDISIAGLRRSLEHATQICLRE